MNHDIETHLYFKPNEQLILNELDGDCIQNKPNVWSLIPYDAIQPYSRQSQRLRATDLFIRRLHRSICIESYFYICTFNIHST